LRIQQPLIDIVCWDNFRAFCEFICNRLEECFPGLTLHLNSVGKNRNFCAHAAQWPGVVSPRRVAAFEDAAVGVRLIRQLLVIDTTQERGAPISFGILMESVETPLAI